jgi:molecular chaperone IbpA
MRNFDTAPLYRSIVGFDRLAALLDAAAKTEAASGYPPYNIESVGENAYRIELAVAGFGPGELSIEARENVLSVTGRKADNDGDRRYLHRGLAARNFERRFQLADYVVVTDAALANGLLSVSLKRELPEALKPRQIPISTGVEKALDVTAA